MRGVDPDAERHLTLDELAAGMQRLTGRSFSVEDGHVDGPGTTRLVVRPHPEVEVSAQSAHVDIGYVLNRERDDATIWDCASGFGATKPDAIASAVGAWLRTTAPVVQELMVGTSEYADHYAASETGIVGRHALHGAILGWGRGDGPGVLQRWWLDNPLLPLLAPVLNPTSWPTVGALRIFFGSHQGQSTTEVKLNGHPLDDAGRLVAELRWPRFEDPAYVRSFVLLIPE